VWAEQDAALASIQNIVDGGIIKPDPSIFDIGLPAGESVATVPVARLWDSDQY
jgi:hypothetical protein